MNEGAGEDSNHESDSDENEMSGKEMWSEEEEDVDEDEDDWETEVMPDVSVSTDADGSQLSMVSLTSRSTADRSPRAELSMNTPERDEEDEGVSDDQDQGDDEKNDEDDDSDECRSPAPKRFKMTQWTSEEEKLAIPAASRSADWSPVLAKTDDGRQVVTISSSSEEGLREVDNKVDALEVEMRRASMEVSVPEGMRIVSYNTGEITTIPDNDIVEEVFQELFNGGDGCDEEKDQGEEED